MKELKIGIPNGHEIDKEKSTFEKIVFKEIENNYPLSVKEIKNRDYYIDRKGVIDFVTVKCCDKNNLSSKERAEAFLALMQLVELRDACNKVDGGLDFNYNVNNYIINVRENILNKEDTYSYYEALHFRKSETRDWFFETHKDLIITAKELL